MIEQYLQLLVTQTILKAAASDILKDYEADSISDEVAWTTAKKNAFNNDQYSQYIKEQAGI